MCFVRVSFCVKNLLSVLLATVHLRQGWIYNDDKMSLTVSLVQHERVPGTYSSVITSSQSVCTFVCFNVTVSVT